MEEVSPGARGQGLGRGLGCLDDAFEDSEHVPGLLLGGLSGIQRSSKPAAGRS